MSRVIIDTTDSDLIEHTELLEFLDDKGWEYEVEDGNKEISTNGMRAIACSHGKIFAACSGDHVDAEWELKEIYYKAHGCTLLTVESVSFDKCHCHKDLPQDFERMIEEIKNNA